VADESESDAVDDRREPQGAPAPVVHSHIAYFFVPLPEPLGLPDGFQVVCSAATSMDWYLKHDESQHDEPPPPEYMAASLRFHHAAAPSSYVDETMLLFEVAEAALPPNVGEESTSESPEVPTGAGADFERPVGEWTIVEVAVPCDAGDLPSSGVVADADEPVVDAVSEAFDLGLAYVREVQRAYFIARRRPIRLVTRESLPFAVPFAVRRLYDDDGKQLPFRTVLSSYLLNMNVHRDTRDPELTEDEAGALHVAFGAQANRDVFTNYLEFLRETKVALEVDGDYRAAVVFAATACEVLLDELLSHMLWEEGQRPEDAAAVFNSWLTARVKSQFQPRLGGVWSTEKSGPVQRWSRDVAAVRNRIVHGGYEPTLDEARVAGDAARELETHLADRFASRVSTYPRTAVRFLGPGLRRRGKWTKRLEALVSDPDEVPWAETFARWRDAMQRARVDSPTFQAPSADKSIVVVVKRADGTVQWVLHDREAAMVAIVDPALVRGMPPAQRESVDKGVNAIALEGSGADISVAVFGATAPEPAARDWVPQYRLVPGAGVMVTGKDLDPT
jgi:hypothetical protein